LNLIIAEVVPTLPAASIARTRKACLPGSTLYLAGDSHGPKVLFPSLHWNVAFGSVAENLNLTLRLLDLAFGPSVIVGAAGALESSR
jgi:hypothetical protein